jgi:hypothetical protein
MSNKIKAPFTAEQVEALNKYQRSGAFHPYTCIGKPRIINKLQPAMERTRELCPNDGLLIATEAGWVCPCGKCTQDWAHEFMTKSDEHV